MRKSKAEFESFKLIKIIPELNIPFLCFRHFVSFDQHGAF